MSSNNDKKYNEIMKNEEIIQQKKTTGIIVGVISGVVLLVLLYRYGFSTVKNKLFETITTVWNFIKITAEKKWNEIRDPTNRLTTIMVCFALIVGGFLIGTLVNMADNPYSNWNTPAMWTIGILSV